MKMVYRSHLERDMIHVLLFSARGGGKYTLNYLPEEDQMEEFSWRFEISDR